MAVIINEFQIEPQSATQQQPANRVQDTEPTPAPLGPRDILAVQRRDYERKLRVHAH